MHGYPNGVHTALAHPAQITTVDPASVDTVWPFVRKYLQEGVLACGEDLDEAFTIAAAKSGQLQIWAVSQGDFVIAAMTSRFWPSRTGMVCHLVVGGGTQMDNWFHLCAQVEEYAKANGCVKVRVAGRNGWERKLTQYRRVGVILEREIS